MQVASSCKHAGKRGLARLLHHGIRLQEAAAAAPNGPEAGGQHPARLRPIALFLSCYTGTLTLEDAPAHCERVARRWPTQVGLGPRLPPALSNPEWLSHEPIAMPGGWNGPWKCAQSSFISRKPAHPVGGRENSLARPSPRACTATDGSHTLPRALNQDADLPGRVRTSPGRSGPRKRSPLAVCTLASADVGQCAAISAAHELRQPGRRPTAPCVAAAHRRCSRRAAPPPPAVPSSSALPPGCSSAPPAAPWWWLRPTRSVQPFSYAPEPVPCNGRIRACRPRGGCLMLMPPATRRHPRAAAESDRLRCRRPGRRAAGERAGRPRRPGEPAG